MLVIVGRKTPVLVRRCYAFDSASHRLEQVAFEVLAQHVHLVVAKVLPVGGLLAAYGERLVHRRQISLVVVHAGGELRSCCIVYVAGLVFFLKRLV